MDKHRRGAIVSSALAQRRAGKNDRIKVGEKRTKKMIQKLKRSLLLQQPTFRQYGSLPRGHVRSTSEFNRPSLSYVYCMFYPFPCSSTRRPVGLRPMRSMLDLSICIVSFRESWCSSRCCRILRGIQLAMTCCCLAGMWADVRIPNLGLASTTRVT